MAAPRRNVQGAQREPQRVREIYFHISEEQKVGLVQAINPKLPPLKRACDEYYTTKCTKNSRPNPERRVPSTVIDRVKDSLRRQVIQQNGKPSTLGFIFQARFGNIYFTRHHRQLQEDVSTDHLTWATFVFDIPFDVQHFIRRVCTESAVEADVNYKVEFTWITNNKVACTCHVKEKDDGSFELVWARVRVSKASGPSRKFDIVRPAAAAGETLDLPQKRVDVRIASVPHTQEVDGSDELYKIAKEIACSMSRRAGVLSMHVLGDDFKVTFLRRKSMQKYSWKDKPDWEICLCIASNSPHFDKLEREQGVPYDVTFEDEPRKEIYFGSAVYYTKPTGDPDVTLSTPDEYLSHFEEFVGASLQMAEILEDTM